MTDVIEIRWHGRGGQGAKTASLLLADAAFNTGKFVQGFPEYGPERMGAPITAYNRISDQRIKIHSNIYEPDYVVIVDETLIISVDVTSGLKENGSIIVNTAKSPAEISQILKIEERRVYTIDANTISKETIGKVFPNTPMLAAVVKISNIMEIDKFIKDMKASFAHKFASKPQVIDGNIKALERSISEIKCGESSSEVAILSKTNDKLQKQENSLDITMGGMITEAGNSQKFKTGDWRSVRPIFIKEKCKQCLLCCPMCPDSSIPVNEEGKRVEFDYDHCKGCGICANVCPFDAIEMEAD